MSEFDVSDSRLSRRGFLRGFAAASALAATPATAKNRSWEYKEIEPRSIKPEVEQAVLAIEKRLETVPEGRTLFVPVGEHHHMASNVVFQKQLLEMLKERGHKIAYGVEMPYNVIRRAPLRPGGDRQFLRHMFNCDADGAASIAQALGDNNATDAVMSNKHLLRSLHDLKISTRFHDLPGMPADDFDLDRRDPLLRKFTAAKRPISAVSVTGMEVRNLALIQGARDHAKDTGARIYIQHTGAFHVFGGDTGPMPVPYRLSLDAMLRRRGEAVFPIVLAPNSMTRHTQAAVASGQALVFDKLPDRAFDYSAFEAFPGIQKRLRRQEVDYLHKMGERDAHVPTPKEERNYRKELAEIARNAKSCPEGSSVTVRLLGPAR